MQQFAFRKTVADLHIAVVRQTDDIAGIGILDLLSHDQGAQDTAFLIGSLLLTAWVITTGYTLTCEAKPGDHP